MAHLDHGDFLDALLRRLQVFLVNRYVPPAGQSLGFGSDVTLRVFLPDLHWVSKDRMDAFINYRFNGVILFPILLDILGQVDNVEVYQTGDRLDFWRQSPPSGMSAEEVFARITGDPVIKPMHDGLNALRPTILRGNHDQPLEQISAPPEGDRPETLLTSDGRLFLTHGHIWDQLERLPAKWKETAVIHAEQIHSGLYQVGQLPAGYEKAVKRQLLARKRDRSRNWPIVIPRPTGAIPLSSPNDIDGLGSMYLDISAFQSSEAGDPFDDFHQTAGIITFGGDVRARGRTEGIGCRLFVVGHTHHARLLVDAHPLDESGNSPLVTMDCGGWIEKSTTHGGNTIPSAQFGVQCGDELRIYQLGEKVTQ